MFTYICLDLCCFYYAFVRMRLFLRVCLVAEKKDGGKKKKIQCSSPFGLVFYFKVG